MVSTVYLPLLLIHSVVIKTINCVFSLKKGIENTQFYCSKAEDILPKLIGRYRNEDVVAIVDPPRAGLREWL